MGKSTVNVRVQQLYLPEGTCYKYNIVQQYPTIEDLGLTENGGLQFWETHKHTVRMHMLFVFLGIHFQGKK